MSENRVDRAIADVNEIVLSNLRRYEAESHEPEHIWAHSDIWPCEHCAALDSQYMRKGKPGRSVSFEAEADFARAEAYQMTAEDRAYLNSLIDEQREQDRLADEDYADRMLERMDEDRFDR